MKTPCCNLFLIKETPTKFLRAAFSIEHPGDVSETVSETVKPDGLILFMKRNRSNPTSVNVATLNLVSGKKPPGKMPPRKLLPGKLPPENKPPRKIPPRKIAPLKIVSLDFCCF